MTGHFPTYSTEYIGYRNFFVCYVKLNWNKAKQNKKVNANLKLCFEIYLVESLVKRADLCVRVCFFLLENFLRFIPWTKVITSNWLNQHICKLCIHKNRIRTYICTCIHLHLQRKQWPTMCHCSNCITWTILSVAKNCIWRTCFSYIFRGIVMC